MTLKLSGIIVVLATGGVGFILWVALSLLRNLARSVLGHGEQSPAPQILHSIQCCHKECGADNPRAARFCRRCGTSLAGDTAGRWQRVA